MVIFVSFINGSFVRKWKWNYTNVLSVHFYGWGFFTDVYLLEFKILNSKLCLNVACLGFKHGVSAPQKVLWVSLQWMVSPIFLFMYMCVLWMGKTPLFSAQLSKGQTDLHWHSWMRVPKANNLWACISLNLGMEHSTLADRSVQCL